MSAHSDARESTRSGSPACATVEISAQFGATVIDSRHLHRPRARYRIGRGAGVDAPAPVTTDQGSSSHLLVEGSGGVFVVNVQAEMTGTVTRQGQSIPLARFIEAHGKSFVCRQGDHLTLRLGNMVFVISDGGPAPRPRALAPRWLSGWRWREQKYTVVTGAVMAAALLAIFLLPPDPRALVLARFGQGVRFLALRVMLAAETPPPPHQGQRTGNVEPGPGPR